MNKKLIVLGIIAGFITACLPTMIRMFFAMVLYFMNNPIDGVILGVGGISIISLTEWLNKNQKIIEKMLGYMK